MLTMTVAEIYDLACMAGYTINHDPRFMPDADEMETEITIEDCPPIGLLDDDNTSRRHYSRAAHFTEYPEEGYIGLGPELTPSNAGSNGPSGVAAKVRVD